MRTTHALHRLLRAALLAGLLVTQGTGRAETLGTPVRTLAVGPGFTPAYEGADEYRMIPFVVARARWGARYSVGTAGTGFRADIFGSRFVEAGPAVSFRFARNSDADDPVIARLPEIEQAIEIGGHLALNFPFPLTANRRDALTVDSEWLWDVSGSHGGQLGRFSLRYRGQVSDTLVVQTGPYLDYRSDTFARTYYGVRPSAAAASGLAPFEADGGISATGYRLNVRVDISDSWNMTASGAVDRKLGDFAESPLTSQRGARTTYFAGLAVGQSF